MVGRNDPCPCGSGKKYKKCCLKRDEEARRAAAAAPPPAAELPAADVTPAQNLWAGEENRASEPEPEASAAGPEADPCYARWEEFEAEEDYEGRIALFLRTLDDGLMDADNAFEMLNVIYEDAVAHDEHERFDALVAQLRRRLPEVYARDAHFYAEWRIANALATGRLDALPALADELADTAGAQLDTVSRVFDQLAYHGQLSVLVRAMRRAWPLVRDANRYFEWAVGEFTEQAMMMALLDYLEHIETPDVAEMDALGVEFAVVPAQQETAARFLAHITGQAGRRWTLADFDLAVSRRRKGEPEPQAADGRLNLYYLTVEFLGYLRRVEGVSYARGELARAELQRYLLERHAGRLRDDDRDRAGRGRAKARRVAPAHPLCPDRATLDRYLAGLLNLFSARAHRAAALFEALPAWLRFLAGCELLDANQHRRTLDELAGLADDVGKAVSSCCSDPALRLVAERWRRDAGFE